MNKQILTIEEIMDIVKPLAEKYRISEVYILDPMHAEKQTAKAMWMYS